ncbi:hypothetical protein SDRG_01200 [Saprolegnia diclina VS20]|uniref:Uncharacterized protein n=1 Tax=Saprolegnia diclina (strain VS20) TaxID=1156394 RepID=T0R4E2_SAPDV|nr:hypothetical protein SDRG_01200 [Saprolegnia diclina VS20]EQC41225.1 hypothetical protein SDRG_01200 [Saprolegnia diclina VS20]|eukprot:XP_008604939.1 hypothetical protein SDRG_01200 [Saprolegnia diclina VS20]
MSYMEKPRAEPTEATPTTTDDYEIVNMPTPEGSVQEVSIDAAHDKASVDSMQEENTSEPMAADVPDEEAHPELPTAITQEPSSTEMTPETTTELHAQEPEQQTQRDEPTPRDEESTTEEPSSHQQRAAHDKDHVAAESTTKPSSSTSRTSTLYAFKRVPVVSREEQKRATAVKSPEATPPPRTAHPQTSMPFIFMQSSPSPTHERQNHTTQQKARTPPQPKHIRIVTPTQQPPVQRKKPVTVTVRVNGVPVAREVVGDEDIVFDIEAPQPPRVDYAAEIARLQRLQEAQETRDRQLWLSQMGISHRPTLHESSYNAQPRMYYMY